MNDAIRMQISAFVDGELPDAEADLLLRRMSQDAALRKQAAEFLEIGRAMRGEPGVPGVERLQERISAELDDKPLVAEEIPPVTPVGRSIRPLVGIAVAASVALLAIVGLQYSPGIDTTTNVAPDNAVADIVEQSGYTVPQPVDDQLRQYVLSHGASASELGGNNMNTRLVTLRLSEEALLEDELPDDAVDDEEPATENPTQP